METTYNELDEIQKNLVDEAQRVSDNGYDPYSHFYVGAAVLTGGRSIYTGANIHTASYASLCAERVAIGNAISNGEYRFDKIAIFAKCDSFEVDHQSGPCGICRQAIWEFSELNGNDTEIMVADSNKDKVLVTRIKELHPRGFGPRLCDGDIEKYLK
jgi:cytidine deaminase